jgi:hypothetical protein
MNELDLVWLARFPAKLRPPRLEPGLEFVTMPLSRNVLAVLILVLVPLAAAAADGARPPGLMFAQNQAASGAGNADETTDELRPHAVDTDLFALMSGKCSTLRVGGRDFACRTVAYAHSVKGRAYFTIALDDPADQHHIISFSGENGRRTTENLYDLAVDRMLLNSTNRPKVDGLPVPATVTSSGRCVQLGNFSTGHVSSVVCSATDKSGRKYELRFESDGSPITVRRVNPSSPTIRP